MLTLTELVHRVTRGNFPVALLVVCVCCSIIPGKQIRPAGELRHRETPPPRFLMKRNYCKKAMVSFKKNPRGLERQLSD